MKLIDPLVPYNGTCCRRPSGSSTVLGARRQWCRFDELEIPEAFIPMIPRVGGHVHFHTLLSSIGQPTGMSKGLMAAGHTACHTLRAHPSQDACEVADLSVRQQMC